ncbi:MAG TPA: glycoside hydrolase family 5 protein [Fibrobacteria bacterium]|nr:glycoside hydrolase family 5 protein [Fibrobacteria bacterium]
MDSMDFRHFRGTRLAALVGALVGLSQAADLPTAATIAADMGLGWNIGNTIETPGGKPYWSNHVPTQAMIDAAKAAGFRSIRIPCGWDTHASNNVISEAWLQEVKTVVDYCIKDGLYVVLNSHWDKGWLEEHIDVGSQASVNVKQKAYWTQIANYFKDYDHHLLFASANEPAVQDAYGTAFGADRVGVLNSYHQTMIDAVRATGGNNATRTLIFQGPRTDIELIRTNYSVYPTDKVAGRLMFEAHFYPYQYTLMTKDESWGNQFFYWGQGNHSTTDAAHNPTWGEEVFVDSQFNVLKRKFVDKGIPAIIGEWGAGLRTTLSGANLDLHKKGRVAYYKYVAKSARAHGVIPFAWDTYYTGDMNFTIIDRGNAKVYDQSLMDAMKSGWGVSGVDERPSTVSGRLVVHAREGAVSGTYTAASAGPATIALTDLRGRTLWSGTIQATAGLNVFEVPQSPKGISILRVKQGVDQEVASIGLP